METYLGKRGGIQLVLAGDLQTDGVSSFGVPGGLSTSFNLSVDLVVVASREQAEIVGCKQSQRSIQGGCIR
jgi:hypothetical protein